jgi:hypothetical protein
MVSLADCEARLRQCEERKALTLKAQCASPDEKISLILEFITKMREDYEKKTLELTEANLETKRMLRPLIFNHATGLALQVLCIHSGFQPKDPLSIADDVFMKRMIDPQIRAMIRKTKGIYGYNAQWKVLRVYDQIRAARNLQAHPPDRKEFVKQIAEILESLDSYLPLSDDPIMQEVHWILHNKDEILSTPHKDRKAGWGGVWGA